MEDITEEILKTLGFDKEVVSPEEAGDATGYYYFTYKLGDSECLISNANDEATNGFYSIEILSIPSLGKFRNEEDVKNLIICLEKGDKDEQ